MIFVVVVCLFVFFLKQGFSVALEPVLELILVDQAGLELTEICLPLPPKCWNKRRAPSPSSLGRLYFKILLLDALN